MDRDSSWGNELRRAEERTRGIRVAGELLLPKVVPDGTSGLVTVVETATYPWATGLDRCSKGAACSFHGEALAPPYRS